MILGWVFLTTTGGSQGLHLTLCTEIILAGLEKICDTGDRARSVPARLAACKAMPFHCAIFQSPTSFCLISLRFNFYTLGPFFLLNLLQGQEYHMFKVIPELY